MKKPAILILAAGTSSRMGQPKQLLPFQKETLLGTVIQNALATKITTIYCVIGAHHTEIETKHKDAGVHFIYNADYEKGLSTSIVTGVKKITEIDPQVSSLLILLGDQPCIDKASIQNYFRSHQQENNDVVVTSYPKGIGVPALFPKSRFTDLLNLKGDYGAKELLKKIEDTRILTLSPDALADIDTEEDYQKALNKI